MRANGRRRGRSNQMKLRSRRDDKTSCGCFLRVAWKVGHPDCHIEFGDELSIRRRHMQPCRYLYCTTLRKIGSSFVTAFRRCVPTVGDFFFVRRNSSSYMSAYWVSQAGFEYVGSSGYPAFREPGVSLCCIEQS